jgi:hypothetical protein
MVALLRNGEMQRAFRVRVVRNASCSRAFGLETLGAEDRPMRVVLFEDGTACSIARVHGEGFDPHEGDRFLFEFPDGRVMEGTVRFGASVGVPEDVPAYNAFFDGSARTLTLEV